MPANTSENYHIKGLGFYKFVEWGQELEITDNARLLNPHSGLMRMLDDGNGGFDKAHLGNGRGEAQNLVVVVLAFFHRQPKASQKAPPNHDTLEHEARKAHPLQRCDAWHGP